MPTSITGNSISLGSGTDATSITNTGILNHAGTLQLGNSTVTTFPAGHVLQIHTCTLTVDLSTTSDGNVTTGLTTSFVPIQGSSARIIAMVQGGAQRTGSTSDRGATSLYINTNNGYTLFKSGEKIDSVANRLLIFDGLKEHSTVVQTDTPARYIINFNLLI